MWEAVHAAQSRVESLCWDAIHDSAAKAALTNVNLPTGWEPKCFLDQDMLGSTYMASHQ